MINASLWYSKAFWIRDGMNQNIKRCAVKAWGKWGAGKVLNNHIEFKQPNRIYFMHNSLLQTL